MTLPNPSRLFCLTAAWLCSCMLAASPAGAREAGRLFFSCAEDNDLYRVMTADGERYPRAGSPEEAVAKAPAGAGVLILADGYPAEVTALSAELFEAAEKKRLRLFVEFPSALPGIEVGGVRRTDLERAVVSSGVFGPSLEPDQILAIHDCHYVDAEAADPHLVVAKVAGYDIAPFGLEGTDPRPLLFEHPDKEILVSTTKLSQFVTARYAPQAAMGAIWQMVLSWLQPGARPPALSWTPTVRPTYSKDERLPADAVRRAVARGIDWHTRATMLVGEPWKGELDKYHATNPVGPPPGEGMEPGDGGFGLLEGFASKIYHDGTQPVRWWIRSDCNGESSLAFALRAKLDGDRRSGEIAGNLLDFLYLESDFQKKDPSKADYGLLRWGKGSGSLYADNDIKVILGAIGTAAVLDTPKWDEALLRNILANFRTTGPHGYRPASIADGALNANGWRHYWRLPHRHYAPHFQAWIWASYLWLYHKTGHEPLLTRTRGGIRSMMENYPGGWRWTNGIQQERGRMLLTLAWLIRVDDRPEHRAWLGQMADDMFKSQVDSGAILEELGPAGSGLFSPPRSNAAYGKNEASAIHENGDPMADMLYTCNFASLGLHEAYAATGEKRYKEMADRLAEFFVRIQVRSEAHPWLDGAWFRAFDHEKWDYWGSNADHGWGAWSVEVGWTQAWVPTFLAMRELGVNLWEMSEGSRIGEHWEKVKAQMLPDGDLEVPGSKAVKHAAVGRPVTLATEPTPPYRDHGAKVLSDGRTGTLDHGDGSWLGFHGEDLEATIDLGKAIEIGKLGAVFLQRPGSAIYLPEAVEFSVAKNPEKFYPFKEVTPEAPEKDTDRVFSTTVSAERPAVARYVRVRARNVGAVPAGRPAAGTKAWLFVDELIVEGPSR